jgi:hypothetical protein
MKRLPRWRFKSGRLEYESSIDRIRTLFDQPNAAYVFELMQELEFEVMAHTVLTGATGEKAFQAVLKKWELSHGFADSLTLMPEVYSASEWRAMLRKGGLPKDPGLNDPFHLQSGFLQHGYDTHRVQMNLVMRDIERNPLEYRDLGDEQRLVRLYTYLGDESLVRGLDWSHTSYIGYRENRGDKPYPGSASLWDALFEGDGFQRDFHNPIFVRQLAADPKHTFWPALLNIFF